MRQNLARRPASGESLALDVARPVRHLQDRLRRADAKFKWGDNSDRFYRELRRDDLSDQPELGTGPGRSGDQYTRIVENPFIKADGERRRLARSRSTSTPPRYANVRQFLMQIEPAAAAGRRADRRAGQLLRLRLHGPPDERRQPPSPPTSKWPAAPGRRASPGPDRHQGPRNGPRQAAAVEPRVPRRRLRLDGRAEQAAAGGRTAWNSSPASSARTTAWRSSSTPAAKVWPSTARAATSSKRSSPRSTAAGRRLDRRRRRHPAGLPDRRGQLHQGRRQPRHPLHRRRLQRRRHQHRRARSGSSRRRPRTRACSSPCSASAAATSTTR